MNKTLKAVRRGIKAAFNPPPSHKFQAAGKIIACSHCGSEGFEWAGVAGISYAGYGVKCCRCSHVEYFGKRPKEQD
jgi:hypothetical protein